MTPSDPLTPVPVSNVSEEPVGLARAEHLIANYLFNEDGESEDWLTEALELVQAALATPAPALDAHSGEPHEFRTACLRCGQPGYLHVSLITPNEVVTIEGRLATDPPSSKEGAS